MKTLNRRDFPGAQYPERIIQFGEGNFLRAFVDWQIDLLNEHTNLNSGVVVVRPIETSFPPSLSTQDGLYTTIIRGLNEKGEAVSDARLIRSVNREISVYSEYDEFLKLAHNPEMRFVFSNTTEAGISYHAGDKFDDAPAVSYPAKLTRLLFERFSHFNGALDKGWIIIPCELIDYNGDALRELVLRYAQEWALPEAFIQWLDQANSFCSTLVDRIVTGYPRAEIDTITEKLNQALQAQGDDIVINLASDEYFKSVKTQKLQGQLIKPVFLDEKNGKFKVISFYAKKARGLMSRYIIENRLTQPEQLKSFNSEGYFFDAEASEKGELVFKRHEQ